MVSHHQGCSFTGAWVDQDLYCAVMDQASNPNSSLTTFSKNILYDENSCCADRKVDEKNREVKTKNTKKEAGPTGVSGQCELCQLEGWLSEHVEMGKTNDDSPWTPWSNAGEVKEWR
jgi:hypothetical protein